MTQDAIQRKAEELVGQTVVDSDELHAKLNGSPCQSTTPVPKQTSRQPREWIAVASVALLVFTPISALYLYKSHQDQLYPCERTRSLVSRTYPELVELNRQHTKQRMALAASSGQETNCKTYIVNRVDYVADDPAFPTTEKLELCDEDLAENLHAQLEQRRELSGRQSYEWMDTCLRVTHTTRQPQ